MPLPANALLQPHCPIKAAWAVFDPVWYLRKYGAALPAGVPRSAPGLLSFYLQFGGSLGHSPSPLFDERFYLRTHEEAAALVRAGRYAFGFDHYCQIGHRSYSGHWLFDDALYGEGYEDLSLANLDEMKFRGRYDHYLIAGQFEHRSAHLLFDGRFYRQRAMAAGVAASEIDQTGAYRHFLYRLDSAAPELPPSIYFDPTSYVGGRGSGSSAIAHYLNSSEPHDPVPEFSERFYVGANRDVQARLEAGLDRHGYWHFLQTGVFELRSPRQDIDLAFYRDANPRVRDDLNTGTVRDAFAHLRAIGLAAGLQFTTPVTDPAIAEAAAKELFIRTARNDLALFARQKLDFTSDDQSSLSVILVMFEKFELTMRALSSLRDNYHGTMQLILVDNGSSDQTREIAHYVEGAVILRLDRNIGYLNACNVALAYVGCENLLFLNNDVELGHGAVAAAIARLASGPAIAAVGGKVIRSHGLLQEAGCIIWRDGGTQGYMRDSSPLAGEANFVRDVDFCSGVFLLCRTSAIRALGGFDPAFSPSYYEDVDLCRRLAAEGYRILYDPMIVIHHLEYGSAGAGAAETLMRRGREIFSRKHAAFLQNRPTRSARSVTAARSPADARKRILFIEDTIPLPQLGSGYRRANDIVHALSVAGHAVSVFPVNGARFDVMSLFGAFPEDVEVLHNWDNESLPAFLEQRPGYYDLIWVSRTHNLARILPACSITGFDPAEVPFVLDTEAIAALRDAGRRTLAGCPFDVSAAIAEELASAPLCRHCIGVSPQEAALLRDMGLPSVSVLGTARNPEPTATPLAERDGLLFVGSIHRPDSPNLDALYWYLQEILPALTKLMAEPPVLNFAGYVAEGIDLQPLRRHAGIAIHGPGRSLREHYERNRLFIAPTRFAAGTPYKLYEAAAYGLPIIATTLLAAQLSWHDGADLLTARVGDASAFAGQIARGYADALLWESLRNAALARIVAENAPAPFNASVAGIVETALATDR